MHPQEVKELYVRGFPQSLEQRRVCFQVKHSREQTKTLHILPKKTHAHFLKYGKNIPYY